MSNKLKILILYLLMLAGIVPLRAQNLEGTERNEALLRILSSYSGWSSVELNGRLDIPNLPMGIKPTVKIYMKNGESIMMSVRAPFMGEVGRAEIEGDTLVVVNKMRHTYCKNAVSYVLKGFPASISDLQSLLLGRISLLGMGELSVENSPPVSLIKADDGSVMVVPADNIQPYQAEYGFLTAPTGRLTALVVSVQGKEDPVTLMYDYLISGGYSLSVAIPGEKNLDATLEFEKPKWGASSFPSFTPDKNYTRLGVSQFFKSF